MKAVYVQRGEYIDIVPESKVNAGDVVVQGDLAGVSKLDIEAGKFTPRKQVHHTHEGSIGNLCTKEIAALFEQTWNAFHFEKAEEAELRLGIRD